MPKEEYKKKKSSESGKGIGRERLIESVLKDELPLRFGSNRKQEENWWHREVNEAGRNGRGGVLHFRTGRGEGWNSDKRDG